jgi:group II intron reverse transcriptase/maturase
MDSLTKYALYNAFEKLNKSASAGIDKETAKQFRENLDKNLEDIVEELKHKKYKAKLVKRVYIPKGENEQRPIGLPVLRDKIVQRAVVDILEAIYEQDFVEESYGYRPGRNAHQAIEAMENEISGKYSYVVEADIKGFFNNIDHGWMLRMLKARIKDNAFLGLIMKWLKAGIMEPSGEIINPING